MRKSDRVLTVDYDIEVGSANQTSSYPNRSSCWSKYTCRIHPKICAPQS